MPLITWRWGANDKTWSDVLSLPVQILPWLTYLQTQASQASSQSTFPSPFFFNIKRIGAQGRRFEGCEKWGPCALLVKMEMDLSWRADSSEPEKTIICNPRKKSSPAVHVLLILATTRIKLLLSYWLRLGELRVTGKDLRRPATSSDQPFEKTEQSTWFQAGEQTGVGFP